MADIATLPRVLGHIFCKGGGPGAFVTFASRKLVSFDNTAENYATLRLGLNHFKVFVS
jgi:hypothetical protein